MNMLTFFSEVSSELSQYIPNLTQAYIVLVVAVPFMIALLLLIAFMILISIVGVSDRLYEIRRLLEDIFSEKLDALDEASRQQKETDRLVRLAAIEERRKSIRPMTKGHKITMSILAMSIPVLLIILVAVIIVFRH